MDDIKVRSSTSLADALAAAVREHDRASRPNPAIQRKLVLAARTSAGAVLAASVVVIVGWVFNLKAFQTIAPHLASMKFLTAAAFALTSTSIILTLATKSTVRVAATWLALAVGLVATLTLAEYAFNWHLGFDNPFSFDTQTSPENHPGRMAGLTATCFVLLSASLLSLQRRRILLSRTFAIGALVISFTAIVGYAFGVRALYHISGYSTMAIHTATAFLLSSVAVLLLRPDTGFVALIAGNTAGGLTVRRLLVPAIAVPVVTAALANLAVEQDLVERPAAFAISTVVLIAAFVVAVILTTARLRSIDLRRAGAEQVLEREQRVVAALGLLRKVAEAANDADTLADTADTCLACVCRVTGWPTGRLWLRDSGTSASASIWHHEDAGQQLAALARVIGQSKAATAEGVGGRVWTEARAVWVVDASLERGVLPAEMISVGVRGAFAFPVVCGDEIVAVFEFFSPEPLEVGDDLVELLTDVGRLLGRVVERQQSAALVHRSQDRTRRIIETARDAFVAIDAEGTVTAWNNAAEDIFGWTAGEAIGERLDRLIIPDRYQDAHRRGLLRFLFTGESDVVGRVLEIEGLRRDGSEFPVELAIWAVREEDWSFNAFIRDISRRKAAEDALRASEERFRLAQLHAPIGLAIVSLDGRFEQVNPALCEIVGRSEDELLSSTFQDITHPDDLEADLTHVDDLLVGRARTYQMEKRYLHSDGHVVWILLSVAIVRDSDEKPLYFIAQIQDVSERHEDEEPLGGPHDARPARAGPE